MNINKIVAGMLGLFLAKKGIKSLAKKKALRDPDILAQIRKIQADVDALNSKLDNMRD
jgi:hypothetical protein